MNKLTQLIEDYERRAKTARSLRAKCEPGTDTFKRLTTKASLYREFVGELRALQPPPANKDEDCRICGSSQGMSGEDELCDECFTNDEQ